LRVSTKVSRVNRKSVRVRRDDRLQINDLLGVYVAEAPFPPSFLVRRTLDTDVTFGGTTKYEGLRDLVDRKRENGHLIRQRSSTIVPGDEFIPYPILSIHGSVAYVVNLQKSAYRTSVAR
jgi:hypothetical protein